MSLQEASIQSDRLLKSLQASCIQSNQPLKLLQVLYTMFIIGTVSTSLWFCDPSGYKLTMQNRFLQSGPVDLTAYILCMKS